METGTAVKRVALDPGVFAEHPGVRPGELAAEPCLQAGVLLQGVARLLDVGHLGRALQAFRGIVAHGGVVDAEVEVASVGGGVDANEQWEEVERLFNEARCMVSNTADRGYETDPADAADRRAPRSFPATATPKTTTSR